MTNFISPYEVLHNAILDYSSLKTFNYMCYASAYLRDNKFSPRASTFIFLVYSLTQKGFILFDTKDSKTLASRHVKFYEDIFPYHYKDLIIPNLPSSITNQSSSEDDPLETPHIPLELMGTTKQANLERSDIPSP